jgi:hypothetical protein
MNKPLRLVDHDEPTRTEIAMAEIEQNHRETKWTPCETPQGHFDVDGILARSEPRYAILDRPHPWYFKLLRRIQGIK